MRGLAGHPADSDRDIGFKEVLKDYPNIKVVPNADGVATGWDPATTTTLINEFISSGQYDTIAGHLDVGHGLPGRRRHQGRQQGRSCRSSAPTSARSSGQLLNEEGLEGAAVTNTAAVGGAGVNLALKLLNGETVETDCDGCPAEHGPAQAGPGRQHERRRQDDARVVAGRRTRPALAARSPDRGLHDVHPRAGRRLQGSRRGVAEPDRPVDPRGDAGTAGVPSPYPEDR